MSYAKLPYPFEDSETEIAYQDQTTGEETRMLWSEILGLGPSARWYGSHQDMFAAFIETLTSRHQKRAILHLAYQLAPAEWFTDEHHKIMKNVASYLEGAANNKRRKLPKQFEFEYVNEHDLLQNNNIDVQNPDYYKSMASKTILWGATARTDKIENVPFVSVYSQIAYGLGAITLFKPFPAEEEYDEEKMQLINKDYTEAVERFFATACGTLAQNLEE